MLTCYVTAFRGGFLSVTPMSTTMKSILYSQLSVILMSGIYADASSALPRLLNHGAMPVGMEQTCLGTVISQSVAGKNQQVSGASSLEIPLGKSELFYKFSEPTQFRSVAFTQLGVEGVVHAFASLDGVRWDEVTSAKISKGNLKVSLDKVSRYGSYLKLEFNASHSGQIVTPMVQTTRHDSDYVVKQTGNDRQTVNFATGLGGARIIYSTATTSSGSMVSALVSFDATVRKDHFLVYDLNDSREINGLSFAGTEGFDSIEIYSGSKLPENEDWKGRLSLSTEAVKAMALVAQVKSSTQPVECKFTSPIAARYVVMKLHTSSDAKLARLIGLSISGDATVAKLVKGSQQSVDAGLIHSKKSSVEVSAQHEEIQEVAFKSSPAVFAWDLERNLNANLMAGSSAQSRTWMNASTSSASIRGRRANAENATDPVALEILRCDFVSEQP